MIVRSTLGRAIPRAQLRAILDLAFAGIDHDDVLVSLTRPFGRSGGSGRMTTPLPARLARRYPGARYLVHCTLRPDWDADYAAYPSRMEGIVFAGRDEFLLVTAAHEARHVAQHRTGDPSWAQRARREADAEAHARARLAALRAG